MNHVLLINWLLFLKFQNNRIIIIKIKINFFFLLMKKLQTLLQTIFQH
jgi:hypothetical protein